MGWYIMNMSPYDYQHKYWRHLILQFIIHFLIYTIVVDTDLGYMYIIYNMPNPSKHESLARRRRRA